jgi:hypothetical protein
LAAKLSKMITNFQGRSSKFNINHPLTSTASKTSHKSFFENSLKSMQIFQILMGGMSFRERLQKTQTFSAVRGDNQLNSEDMYHQIVITVFPHLRPAGIIFS